jgi:CcmD family protein
MRTIQVVKQLAVGLVVSVFVCGVSVAAQVTPPAQTDFRAATPEDLAAGQEHLAASPLVYAAYAIVWLVLVVYVWSLWRRIAKTEGELAAVRAKLEARH